MLCLWGIFLILIFALSVSPLPSQVQDSTTNFQCLVEAAKIEAARILAYPPQRMSAPCAQPHGLTPRQAPMLIANLHYPEPFPVSLALFAIRRNRRRGRNTHLDFIYMSPRWMGCPIIFLVVDLLGSISFRRESERDRDMFWFKILLF